MSKLRADITWKHRMDSDSPILTPLSIITNIKEKNNENEVEGSANEKEKEKEEEEEEKEEEEEEEEENLENEFESKLTVSGKDIFYFEEIKKNFILI